MDARFLIDLSNVAKVRAQAEEALEVARAYYNIMDDARYALTGLQEQFLDGEGGLEREFSMSLKDPSFALLQEVGARLGMIITRDEKHTLRAVLVQPSASNLQPAVSGVTGPTGSQGPRSVPFPVQELIAAEEMSQACSYEFKSGEVVRIRKDSPVHPGASAQYNVMIGDETAQVTLLQSPWAKVQIGRLWLEPVAKQEQIHILKS